MNRKTKKYTLFIKKNKEKKKSKMILNKSKI